MIMPVLTFIAKRQNVDREMTFFSFLARGQLRFVL